MKTKLIILFIIAFLVRLIAINQSLWLDEGTTAKVIQTLSLTDIITKFSPADFHPPLFYLWMRLHSLVFGYSEFWLRLPSVNFSLLSGWFVYLIGKKLKNEQTGFWAAAFFLFNPLIVYYSQEARMYMMVTFWLAIATLMFIYLIGGKRGRAPDTRAAQASTGGKETLDRIYQIIFFNIAIFLSFLTFYGSIFLIVSFYLYLIWKKQWPLLLRLLPGFVLALIVISPLLYQQYLHSREALRLVVNWTQVLGKANLKNLLLIPLKFSIGRISFFPKSVYYALTIPWTILLVFLTMRNAAKSYVLLFLLAVPLIIGLLFSFLSPLLQYFRFLYLIIFMSILLAFSLQKDWQRYVILAGLLVFSLAYLLLPQFHREDWKSLAQDLSPGTSVYAIESSMDALRYYNQQIVIHNLLDGQFNGFSLKVIPYTAEIYGYNYRQVLEGKGYVLLGQKDYRGLTLEEWSHPFVLQ